MLQIEICSSFYRPPRLALLSGRRSPGQAVGPSIGEADRHSHVVLSQIGEVGSDVVRSSAKGNVLLEMVIKPATRGEVEGVLTLG